ncbi:hypothetical protein Hamer_G000781 [Homarus americanus]|uniref:Uncharacterized protein n=1 Tax=Homarus americanus TaxID=6706 RepID=A0A8J5TEY2_HOMAM|nr:hypothetical protein Hamer_G000781 [Homarus americanus]
MLPPADTRSDWCHYLAPREALTSSLTCHLSCLLLC